MEDTAHRIPRPGAMMLALGAFGLFAPAFSAEAQSARSGHDPDERPADAGQGSDLGGVTVTDTAIDEEGYKTERLSSPKATAPLVDTPRSITVVPRQLLEDTNSTTLVEALRTVPGITLGAGEGGNPLGDRPFLRGADSSNSLYLDGVRDLAAQAREMFDVQQIEVTKGSDSVTNGSANAGGSINIVSKRPESRRFVQLDAGVGNADYKRFTLDLNQPLSESVGFRLNAMYHDQGIAGRDYVWNKRWGIAPSIKFGMNGPTSLEFDWYHMHSTAMPDTGIPYATVFANQPSAHAQTGPLGTSPLTALNGATVQRSRGTFYGLLDRDFQTTNNDEVSSRLEHQLGNGFVFTNLIRYNHTTQEYFYVQPDDSAGNIANYGTLSRRANQRYSYQSGFVEQAALTGKFATGALKHDFAAALEYDWEKSGYGSFVANQTTNAGLTGGTTATCPIPGATGINYNCTSASNPNPNDPWVGTIVRSLPIYQTLANEKTFAASLFDTIRIGKAWVVTLGGRYDHYATNASATGTPAAGRSWVNSTKNIFTYQAGIAYKPLPNGTIYVSTSTAAVPPGSFLAQGREDNALTSTPGITADDLKVQKTTSYEVGTKWNLFHDALSLTADVFQTRTSNARVTAADGASVAFVGLQRIRGVELGVSGNVTPLWSLFGGYTYMKSVILNGGTTATRGTNAAGVAAVYYAPTANTGLPMANTPNNSFTLFTTYKVTPRLTLGGGAIYMSRVYGGFSDQRSYVNGVFAITRTRAVYVPDYWRFDLNADYKVNSFLTLKLSALNLTDKLYYDQAYAAHYTHQAAGRTVIGTLSVRY